MNKYQGAETILLVLLLIISVGCIPNNVNTSLGTEDANQYVFHETTQNTSYTDLEIIIAEDAHDPQILNEADYQEDICTMSSLSMHMPIIHNGIEFSVIEKDIVEIETRAFGAVRLVPVCSLYPRYLEFFLEKEGLLIYKLPDLDIVNFERDDLIDLFYGDLNDDGLDDIIAIAVFSAYANPSSHHFKNIVFFQQDEGFYRSEQFEDFLTSNTGWYEKRGDPYDLSPEVSNMECRRVSIKEILEFINYNEVEWDIYIP